jgi:hypothetical protein
MEICHAEGEGASPADGTQYEAVAFQVEEIRHLTKQQRQIKQQMATLELMLDGVEADWFKLQTQLRQVC